MKTLLQNRLIILYMAVVTVGLASCSSSSPLIGDAQSYLKDQNYDAADSAAQQYISQFPGKPMGYYYKGVVAGQRGSAEKNPGDGTAYFKTMDQAFKKAKSIADTMQEVPSEIKNIDAVRQSLWGKEHNQAVAYARDDSIKNTVDDPLQYSVDYVTNATIIEPDSAKSWNVLALVQNQRKDYGEAAQAQQKYISLTEDPGAKSYLLLSQFYRMDDQLDKSITALESGHKKYPQNNQIIENLADTYSRNKQSDKSISIVKDLVKNDPQNPQYHLSLGTQIYKKALNLQDKYEKNVDKIYKLQQNMRKAQGNSSKTDDLKQQIQQLEDESNQLEQQMNKLSDQAVEQLQQTIKYRNNDEQAYNTLGIIYQNKAKTYFDKRMMTDDNAKVKQLNQKAKGILRKSMTNYEKAAQINPDNQKYWRSLYQVYTALGMDQKAQNAKSKAGMQ